LRGSANDRNCAIHFGNLPDSALVFHGKNRLFFGSPQYMKPETSAILRFWRVAVVTWAVAACTPVPPKTYPLPEPATFDASFGRTWDAVIDHFAVGSIPIATIERASGLIVTRPLRIGLSRESAQKLADCGTDVLGTAGWPTESSYNIRVTGDSAKSTMRVTAIFVGTAATDGCNSKGTLESALISAIGERVRR
jgi:hypothetical protein